MSTRPLPYITAQLPGIGGRLRATPDHFVVAEVALYEPSDEGTHLYVNLTKRGLTTREVMLKLESALGVGRGQVGYAGLKDKHAVTTQTFSIPCNHPAPEVIERMRRQIGELGLTVHWARRHKNKLKTGHLLGNRFRITISELALPIDELDARLQAIGEQLQQRGLPNYFGVQRFGHHGENAIKGYEALIGKRRIHDQWMRRFSISAYQSQLCNDYLARRIEQGWFNQLLAGDVAKKHSTGGIFDVTDVAVEQPRFEAHEISFTAPLFGGKMKAAQSQAGELEQAVLNDAGVTLEQFRRAHIDGTRRLGRLLVPDLQTQIDGAQVVVEFFLPKGAFATTVLRELMKVDDQTSAVGDDDEASDFDE